ncbi:CocE/NonD family hydrolase, partial [Acinetobacter baumannii]
AAAPAALAAPKPAKDQVAGASATLPSDIPAKFELVKPEADYIKRVEMIPMRDGVKLYTVIWIPKGVRNAPIILTRTPYNAAKHMRTETASL